MKIEQRINQIKLISQKIAHISISHALTEPFYWPLIELIDIDDEAFVLKLYSEADDACLPALYETHVIGSLVESLQSQKLIDFIKKQQTKHMEFIDNILVMDLESRLFINFDDPPDKSKADSFLLLYRKIKYIVKSSSGYQDESDILKHIDKLTDLVMLNRNEYFSYVTVYWLKSYFANTIHSNFDKEKIRERTKALVQVIPCLKPYI